ncbi:MAG: hypothetical protein ACQERZ_05400 [Fusobacteriota bacterium]
MLKKSTIYFFIFLISSLTYGASENIEAVSGNVQVDFENEEFYAEDGLKLQYEDIKIQANRIKKEDDKNELKAYDKVIFNQGENTVEADSIDVNLDTKIAKIYDGKSFTDDVYYGGEKIVAEFPDEVEATNSYFTTCSNEEEHTHYKFKTKTLKIYPGDKIIAYNTFLYIGKYPVMWFPIYISSLKKKTKAPLFPKIGSDEEFGKYIIWGLDYGRESQYLNGSLALKWSEKQGLLINSWENAYEITDKSTGKLTLRDTFIIPKGDFEEQWKFQWTHKHKEENQDFDWDYKNESTNTINELKADDQEGKSKTNEKKLIRAKLKGDFKKLGPSDDISGNVDIEYTNSENLVKQLIDDALEDLDDQEEFDNDLRTILKLTKDNRRHKLFGHYENISDLDPGSHSSDTLSYKDKQEYQVNLKTYKIDMHYNIEDKDVWKKLSLSEQENDSVIQAKEEDLGYDLKTIKQYDFKKLEEYDLKLGNYNILDTKFKWGMDFHKKDSHDLLNRDKNADGEYFNQATIIEKKEQDENANFTLKHTSRTLKIGVGQNIEYEKEDNGDEIDEDSSYLTLSLSDSKIPLYVLDDLNAEYKLRKDWFIEKDELEEHFYKVKQNQVVYDNKSDYSRNVDLKLTNNIGYEHKFFNYDLGERDLTEDGMSAEEVKEERLTRKEMTKKYTETFNIDLGNTSTKYDFVLSKNHDAFKEEWLKKKDISNGIEFKLDNKRKFKLDVDNLYEYEEDGYNKRKKDDIGINVNAFDKKIGFDSTLDVRRDSSGEGEDKFTKKVTENDDKGFSYGLEDWDFKYSIGTRRTKEKSTKDDDFEIKSETETTEYKIKHNMGDEITKEFEVIYRDIEDKIVENNSNGKFDFNFKYLDKGEVTEEEEEEVKEEDDFLELGEEERAEIERILQEDKRKDLGFNLMGLTEDEIEEDDDESKEFIFNLDLDHNKEYNKNNKYLDSLTNLKIRLKAKYKRKEFNYSYTQNRDIDNTDNTSELTLKKHTQSFKYYFGKKDYEWNVGYDITFNDIIEDDENRITDYGINIGHKIHCTDFEIGIERDWNKTDEEYDTVWTFKFWITAFPDKKLLLHRKENEDGEQQIDSEFGI